MAETASERSSDHKQKQPWYLVSWHGVGGEAPETWNIVAATGTPSQGYLRADGPDEQSVEFRWKRSRLKPDLEKAALDYLKQIKKYGKKQKIESEGDVLGSKSTHREKPTELRFRWQADRKAVGKLFWCADCKRTIIAQVSGPKELRMDDITERILAGVRDHGIDRDAVDWGVYNLSFSIPKKLRLIRQRLMSGFMSMNFRGRSIRCIVERWGLAETLLEEEGFLGWHDREYLAELRWFHGTTTALEWGDHEALETEGYEGGIRRVKSFFRAFGIPGRMERFGSIVWHCPKTNRIVGVRAFGRKPLDTVRAVAASVRCHAR